MNAKFVSRLMVLAGVTLAACTAAGVDNSDSADLIVTNAQVITVSSNIPSAQAVAVRGDRIIAVGRNQDMDPYKGSMTRVIDAQGRTLLPGLYDSQVQSYKAAVSELNAPLPVLTSIAEAQDYIRQQAKTLPTNSWIVLDRLYPTRMKEGRLPTLKELDAATTNHPVYWNCGPVAVLNSQALKLAKITNGTPAPLNGQILIDRKTQKPTGVLRNCEQLVRLPDMSRLLTRQMQREALQKLYKLYNEQGITSIGELRSEPEAIDLFREMAGNHELTVRINCARGIELEKPLETLDDALARLDALTNSAGGKPAYGPTGVGDDWVRIGPLTTTIDGDITVGTAFLRTPWGIGPTYHISEPAFRGMSYPNMNLLPDFCLESLQRGWQLTAHASGDAAMDLLLRCYQYVNLKTNVSEHRLLISQANFQASQNWQKCRELAVSADIQPIWLYKDGFSLTKTLGPQRMEWFLPLKTWFAKGLIIGGGSGHVAKLDSHDSTNPWNPWLGIWTTLTRQTEQGTFINPAECLSREQAIRLYTINNAYLNFEDKKKGSIEQGKLADLILIDRDILKCPVDDVKDTKVLFTMVGGKIVWESKWTSDLEQTAVNR